MSTEHETEADTTNVRGKGQWVTATAVYTTLYISEGLLDALEREHGSPTAGFYVLGDPERGVFGLEPTAEPDDDPDYRSLSDHVVNCAALWEIMHNLGGTDGEEPVRYEARLDADGIAVFRADGW